MFKHSLGKCDIPDGTERFELRTLGDVVRVQLVRDGALKHLLRDSLKYSGDITGMVPPPELLGADVRYKGIAVACASRLLRQAEIHWSTEGRLLVATLPSGLVPKNALLTVSYSRVFNFGADQTYTVAPGS